MAAKTAFDGFLSKSGLKELAGEKYFERGLAYFEAGSVIHLRCREDGISARVLGTQPCPYLVRFWLVDREMHWGCTCPLGVEGAFCKHLVATGLAWLSGGAIEDEPDTSDELQGVRVFLETIDKQTLVELIGRKALWDDGLVAELMLAARACRHNVPANQPRARNRPAPGKSTDSSATKRPK